MDRLHVESVSPIEKWGKTALIWPSFEHFSTRINFPKWSLFSLTDNSAYYCGTTFFPSDSKKAFIVLSSQIRGTNDLDVVFFLAVSLIRHPFIIKGRWLLHYGIYSLSVKLRSWAIGYEELFRTARYTASQNNISQ